ncbi:MAG: hypothetical protein RL346_279 [Verrucomicrobiota bacterium]|jgi:glyoxylase-like metal-dependent hydrolase (beta-lactamase superfamily II)
MSLLEDGIADVLGKAMRGLGKTAVRVCVEAGISQQMLQQLLDGGRDETALLRVATVLGLDAEALIRLPDHFPELAQIEGVTRLSLPFRSWKVNAWLLETDGVRLLFDTGWNAHDIIEALDGALPDAVMITHGHEDHVGGNASIESMGIRILSETEALERGRLDFGKIRIEVADLSGHCVPAASYLVSGFSKPLWVVGDAIFAGSMGGCKTPEQFILAKRTLRDGFDRMSAETLILPGHGPMTSVADERVSNPFHPHFTSAKHLH